MLGPKGVLAFQGDLKRSYDCDTEAVEFTTTTQVPNAMIEIFDVSKKLTPSELEIPMKTDTSNNPQPSEEVQLKAIDLSTGDNSKTTIETTRISANGIPNLSTSVVVPGGLPRAIPVSAMP
jgi:hypothetical protein